jgi:hypothetical protein
LMINIHNLHLDLLHKYLNFSLLLQETHQQKHKSDVYYS